MHCYSIHLFPLDSFQESYFYPRNVCDHNRELLNGTSAYKAVNLSITNANQLPHFIGTLIFICVVTISIKNIIKITPVTLAD